MRHRLTLRRGLMLLALSLVSINLASQTARGQISAEESVKKAKPAEGLEATLWASEPMVVNPTNMDIDSRGRVWVTEGLNYRLTRGRNKEFPLMEEADRIKILEDTDGDGKADKMTVFADHIFPIPMGIAVEEKYDKTGKYVGCKVYVGNSPNLMVFEDTDGDDKADKRYALLTGFGGIDSDHGVHGMVLGLDGKLYFTHGDGCCSVQPNKSEMTQNFDVMDASGRHVKSDQLGNTLRVNRDGTQFEVIADRQRNNYETSLNSFGNIFTSDNDDDGNRGCRVIWMMDGGAYGYRTPGSPRHWGEDVPGSVPKIVGTGNGSPCGITVYEGELLGPDYRGSVFEADAGTRVINHFPITRKGAAFRTEAKILLASDDPWFRPVDMTTAPDGAVFVADWYDAGVGGHAFKDQTTGRIYRVAPKGNKAKKVEYDFGSLMGLRDALMSPNIATQFATREVVAKMEKGSSDHQTALRYLAQHADLLTSQSVSGQEAITTSRFLYLLQLLGGDEALLPILKAKDAIFREQAVRMLGRDCRDNGSVEYTKPAAKLPAPAEKHLKALIGLANDPDAGVRRELILAFRNMPTTQVGDALKTLAASWDGQDRWYLEALGLAFQKRESVYLASLFDGKLFGDMALPKSGTDANVAVPPYFPIDRNEAFMSFTDELPPASALSKNLGLAWRLHRSEVLPLLTQVYPSLMSGPLQQAGDDVLKQITDPVAAAAVATIATHTTDLFRKRQLLATLSKKLDREWREARGSEAITIAIDAAMRDPKTQASAIALAASTGDARYGENMYALALDTTASEEVRVAAVEAIGTLKLSHPQDVLNRLIASSKDAKSSNAVAEAAIRTLPATEDARTKLLELMNDSKLPLGLRRESLRTFAGVRDGGLGLIALAKENRLPKEMLVEAMTVVHTHPDRRVRDEAAQVLPLPKSSTGRALPSVYDLIRREGKAERGKVVFAREGTNSCASCHRAQGRGNWIGPDLSTIGTKYGREELFRSILNPSAAIGYNFRSHVVAMTDGRIFTGLPIEDTADRLILKTAEGQKISIKPGDIEERKTNEVSLMPEGLAQSMTDQELVDLLVYLETLKQPVSIVGQYAAIGPMTASMLPKPDDVAKHPYSWRLVNANAESLIDVAPFAGDDPLKLAVLEVPITSEEPQQARLVLDTKAEAKVFLDGKELTLKSSAEDPTMSTTLRLPHGRSRLMIWIPGGDKSPTLVTTIVAPKPVEFK